MSKKIIIFGLLGIILFVAVWFIGYSAMENYQIKIQNEELFNDAKGYLLSNQDLIAQYGSIDTIEFSTNHNAEFIESGLWHIPAVVKFESNKTYLVWIEADYISNEFRIYQIDDIGNDSSTP